MTEKPAAASRRGRRRGKPNTRETILSAAQQLFTTGGFENTSIRAIARHADVDPALVHHYFHDKVGVLLATVEVTLDLRILLQRLRRGDPRTLGKRLVATVLTAWQTPLGNAVIQVLRHEPALFHSFTEMISTNVADLITENLGLTRQQATSRLAMIETLIGGMIMTRYIARMEPMASLPPQRIVGLLGPLVQQVIDEIPGR